MHGARDPRCGEGAAAGMRASELAARAAGTASRLTGRGGTSLPGKLLLRMEPRAIERLARPLDSAILSARMSEQASSGAQVLQRAAWISQVWMRESGQWRLMDVRLLSDSKLK